MEYQKNDLVTLEISDIGVDGEGIGKADGFTVFVKDAVIECLSKPVLIPEYVAEEKSCNIEGQNEAE